MINRICYNEFKSVAPDSGEPLFNPEKKLLSVLCQGRNDSYMGDFKWRLGTVLNKIARNLFMLGVEREIEILVADWGSNRPLYKDLDLCPEARRIVTFLLVPPEIACIFDRDTVFSSAHPINSVARRARGKYVMFSDSDIYIPLESMAKLIYSLRSGHIDSYSLDESFFWASKHHIPNNFIRYTPTIEEIDSHIARKWSSFPREQVDRDRFLGCGVCLLMKRSIWFESTGWDERLIYWGWNDIDLHRRLTRKYRWDDLEYHGMPIFHLEHYGKRKKGTKELKRKANPQLEPTAFAPNPQNWGLADYALEIVDAYGRPIAEKTEDSDRADLNESGTIDNLRSVKEIVSSNPIYRDVSDRFAFEPHGFFTNQEPLGALLGAQHPKSICEIGSWMGASARFFAEFPSTEKIVCVDHWDRNRVEGWVPGAHPERLMNNMYEQFLANCIHAGHQEKIYPLRIDSAKASRYLKAHGLRFDLIYIDGEHNTVGAKRDIRDYFSLLSENGVLCGDDWSWQKAPDNVAGAACTVGRDLNCTVFSKGNFWVLLPEGHKFFPFIEGIMDRAEVIEEGNTTLEKQKLLLRAVNVFRRTMPVMAEFMIRQYGNLKKP